MSSSHSEPPIPAADPLACLPHRPPFRFLTRIDALEAGRSGRGHWEVRGDEPFLAGHFPGRPLVPGVLVAEALAQLSGVVAFCVRSPSAPQPPRPATLAHVDLRFKHAVEPPATVELHASLRRSVGPLHMFDVAATIEGRSVARGALALAEGNPGPDGAQET